MTDNRIASIVEILDPQNNIIGMGFFVDSNTIVTCAHVVEDALSGPGRSIAFKVNVNSDKKSDYTAIVDVKSWQDLQSGDIAILQTDEVVEGVKPVLLGELIGSNGFIFQTYGIPPAEDKQDEIDTWGNGTISGKTYINNVEFFQVSSETVTTGFSGAPAWDLQTGIVIGMVSMIRKPDSLGRLGQVAYILPAKLIAAAYPAIDISKLYNLPESCYAEYQLLSQEIFSARSGDTQAFYHGSEPTWSDIIADRDIERDPFPKILEMAERNYGRAGFVLLSGQPGSGKSTLLKRIGYALYQKGHAVLFHHNSSDVLQINLLRQAYNAIQCPIYILVDNIFRKQNAQGFLADLSNLELPFFLITTSRVNELEETRISLRKFTEITEFELNVLSSEEIDRLIYKLSEQRMINISGQDSISSIKNLIQQESQLLVIMTRLIAGRDSDFETILRDELRGLERGPLGPKLYEAYTYICALYSVGVAIPVTLLRRLISSRDIYRDVINRREVKGLIEQTEDKKVRARHEYIAEIIMRQVWTQPDQVDDLYISIIQECNLEDAEERRMVFLLLSSLLSHGRKISARYISEQVSSMIFDDILLRDDVETIIKGWGKFFRQLENVPKQEMLFQFALTRFPNEYRAHLEYGWFLENLGRMDEAESHLEMATQQEGDTSFSSNSYAAFLIRQKRFSEAQIVLDDALHAFPGNKYILSTYALLLKEQGIFDAAETYYKAAVESDPHDIFSRTTYAKFLWPLGRTDEALHHLEHGLEKNVLAVNTLHVFARYCREVRQIERAIKFVRRACNEYPQNKITRQLLINLLADENHLSQAIEQCEIGLWLFSNDAWFKRQYVDLLIKDSRIDKAANQLLEYVEKFEPVQDDYLLLAKLASQLHQDAWINMCLEKITDILRAYLYNNRGSNIYPLPLVEVDITYLQKFVERNREDIVSRLLYIQFLINRDRTEELDDLFSYPCTTLVDAELLKRMQLDYIFSTGNLVVYEDALLKAKEAYPNAIWAVRELVKLLDRLDRQVEADQLLQTIIRKFPDELWLYTARLKLLGKLGNQSEFDSQVKLISELFPEYLPGKLVYIDKLIREESYDQAENLIKEMIADGPNDASVRHKYATLLLETNRLGLAEKQLTDLLYLNSNDVGGRLTLVNLLRTQGREKEADIHIQYLKSVRIAPMSMYTALSSWGVKQNVIGKDTLQERIISQPTATGILSQYVRLLEIEKNEEAAQSQIEQSIAAVTPPRSSLRRLYAECLVRWQKPEDAEIQLKLALDEHPNKPLNYISYARFLDKFGHQEDARAVIRKAQSNETIKMSPRWLTIMAGMSYKSGNMDNARDYYWLAQMVDDNDAVSHFTYANFLEEIGESESAEQHYKRAIALNPAYVNANQAYAVFLSNHSDNMNAVIAQFENTLTLDSKNASILCAYADFLSNKRPIKDWRHKTEELLEAAISHDPNHFQSSLLYALFLKQEKKFDKANVQFKYAIEKNKQAYAARQAYAVFLTSQKQYAEAQAQFLDAFDPRDHLFSSRLHNAMVHNGLADLFEKMRQPEEVIVKEYEAAMNIEPHSQQSRFHLLLAHTSYAKFLCHQGHVDQAREHFEMALKLQPYNTHVKNAYASCLTIHGQLELAINLYQQVLTDDPYQENALGGIAKILCKLERYEEADQYFDLAFAKDPNNKYILPTYMESFYNRGRIAEGEKVRKHLELLEPKNPKWKVARAEFSPHPVISQSNARELQNQAFEQKNSGNFDRARELFRAATEKDSATGWQPWALMEKELGNITEARALFQRTTQEKPMDPAGWQAWALLELDAGNLQEALNFAEQSVALNPDDFYPYMARGRVYQIMGSELKADQDFSFARQSLEQQLEKKNDSTKLLNLLGRVLIWQKEYEKAEEVLRSSLSHAAEKEKHFALNGLGELYEARGLVDDAVAFWKDALSYQHFNLVVRKHLVDHDVDVAQVILDRPRVIDSTREQQPLLPLFPAGTIAKLNFEKKFGFITDKDGREYFFKIQSANPVGVLQEDDPVDFDVTETDRGTQAINVIVREKIRYTGQIKLFNQERGFGFIAIPGGLQIFFHVSNVVNPDVVSEEAQVNFVVINTRKGRQARDVEVLGLTS